MSKKIRNNRLIKNIAEFEYQPNAEIDFDSANVFVKNKVHFSYSKVSQELKSVLPYQGRDGKVDTL